MLLAIEMHGRPTVYGALTLRSCCPHHAPPPPCFPGYLLHTLNGNVEVVQKGMAQHLGTAARHLSTAAVSFGLGNSLKKQHRLPSWATT